MNKRKLYISLEMLDHVRTAYVANTGATLGWPRGPDVDMGALLVGAQARKSS